MAKANQNPDLKPVSVTWSPISGAVGYVLHFGTKPGNYSASVDVGNVSEYIISEDFEPGIYYFAVTAYDEVGNESGFSVERIIDLTT